MAGTAGIAISHELKVGRQLAGSSRLLSKTVLPQPEADCIMSVLIHQENQASLGQEGHR